MPMTHKCAVQECDKEISSELLMCRKHWFLVPLAIRRRVLRAWSDFQIGNLKLEALRAVQQEAADAVAAEVGQ